jgi:formylglycine-generating enzyme required for sulfatase activity
MALDIDQIRDEFVALAKKHGLRVEELAPAKGYTFSADVYAESVRVGRLLMRKTTISWRPKGSKKLQRLNTRRDVKQIVNAFETPTKRADTGADEPAMKATPPPSRTPPARPAKQPKPTKKRPVSPEPVEPAEPLDAEKPAPIEMEAADSVPPSPPERQATSLSRAVAMFKEGDFKKALDWAKLALAENPDSAAAKDILERAQRLLEAKVDGMGEQREPARDVAAPIEPSQAAAAGSRPGSPPSVETPPKVPPAAPPSPAVESEIEGSRRRLSPWVVVALMAAILGIIIFKPPSGGTERTEPEAVKEVAVPSLSDSLTALRRQVARLKETVDTDVTGRPAGELISLLTQIVRLDPGDTATFRIVEGLALRADSLAVRALEANQFSEARKFLDEALLGWRELQRHTPNDSLLADRIARTSRTGNLLDLRRTAFAAMVYVPKGTFRMGSDAAGFDARPERDIELSAFWADKFEVTNQQYQAFLLETGAQGPSDRRSAAKPYSWNGNTYPEGTALHPVVLVTWEEAVRFAQWMGKTLPTEAQWERIARGTDGRHYPWGDTFHPDSLACPVSKPAYNKVGVCSGDESPCGARDCASSVREWTNDWYDPEYYFRSSSRVTDPLGPRGGRERVVRGGSWREEAAIAGLTHRRSKMPPSSRSIDLGFRLVIADSLYPDELRESKNAPRNSDAGVDLQSATTEHLHEQKGDVLAPRGR